jgi:HSP20 family protein
MQDHTKDQDAKSRRSNPIHIVEGSRLVAANADALRDAHMSLVRAEQNLFNLVQASHGANNHASPVGFTYPVTATALGSAYAAPGFAPGFGPAVGLPSSTALPFGIAHSPWGATQPAIAAWPQPPVPSWAPLAASLAAATPGPAIGPALFGNGFLPGTTAFPVPGTGFPIPAATAFPGGITARTPACDVVDEGKQFLCLVDLPGLRADQVELLCSEHALIITAYPATESDVASLVQAERSTAAVQRTIPLPNEVQPAGVKATLSNGVLSVTLPKVHPTEGPRRVKVQG